MSDKTGGCLDSEVQRLLGAALREEYRDFVAQLPERFVRLLLPLHELRGRTLSASNDNPPAPPPQFEDCNFDPATIAVLTESLEIGWATLQSIGNATITRETLALCLLDLARTGQRNAARLSSTALVRLLAQPSR